MKESKTKMREKSSNRTQFVNYLVVLLYVLLISCKPIVKNLGPFSSPNIEESKKTGALLWEYNPVSAKINDTIDFDMKEVFAEKQYGYESYNDSHYKIADDKFQIIIVGTKGLTQLGHFHVWVLDNFRAISPISLKKDYEKLLPPDTVLVKILRVDINVGGGSGKDDKKEIGSFVLRRK